MSSRKSASRKEDLEKIPDLGDPDRKRALNVLAQRRYRRRKREQVAELEAKLKKAKENTIPSPATTEDSSPGAESNNQLQDLVLPHSDPFNFGTDAFAPLGPQDFSMPAALPSFVNPQATSLAAAAPPPFMNVTPMGMDVGMTKDFSLFSSPTDSNTWANSLFTSTNNFMDDYTFDIPMLKSYMAITNIAELIGLSPDIFVPTYLHTLQPITDRNIPAWLQPTKAQQVIPHHPFIDVLPWPSVRTKFCIFFSIPDHKRPPIARGTMGVVNMMHDMDHETEGVRLEGEDGTNPESWEVGQEFFRKWWFALDHTVIRRSNELRAKRGAAKLEYRP